MIGTALQWSRAVRALRCRVLKMPSFPTKHPECPEKAQPFKRCSCWTVSNAESCEKPKDKPNLSRQKKKGLSDFRVFKINNANSHFSVCAACSFNPDYYPPDVHCYNDERRQLSDLIICVCFTVQCALQRSICSD